MRYEPTANRYLPGALCAIGLVALLGGSGCQTSIGGQTLPSPHYLTDDVQYMAPGPEFKLAREAAAQKAFAASQAAAGAGAAAPAAAGPAPGPQPPPNAGARSGSMGPGYSFSNDGVYVTGSR
jgi:hypothetical protein